jgi:Domain of unknown function (DUF5103)
MKNITILLLLCFSPFLVLGQDPDAGLVYGDKVYMDNIYSVKFSTGGLLRNYPIIQLSSNTVLTLSFDEIGDEARSYVYTLVHCDADWKPSNISDLDYIEGFNEDDIDTYDFSFNTKTNYTNYQIALPNSELSWRISGNYLLKIYDNTDDKQLAITRRFTVVDPSVAVNGVMRRTASVSKERTHQELDFSINYENFPIRNPHTDIKVVVLQNGRWDTAIKGLKPMFVRQEDLIYDHQDKVVFPAGKEFRQLDFRTFEYLTNSMAEVQKNIDDYQVTLKIDIARSTEGYVSYEDLNGKFIIESMEERDAELRAEYGYALFTLKENPPFENHDVYLFGEFTDWLPEERYKMVYNPLINSYVAKILLKQGFYNYVYALVDKKTKEVDLEELEGNWHEAENDYTVLVYYAPFGARYEQVIGVGNFNSVR